MTAPHSFDFAGPSVSDAYDRVLVPLLFDPWAERLLEQLPPQPAWCVLDLATGTGIVAQRLAERGAVQSVVGVDVSAEMLAQAKLRCAEHSKSVTFIESPAHPLNVADNRVDAVYCQQGFQFFPNKPAAAREMHRVLKPKGKVAVATWCPIEQCDFFGVICTVLRQCGEQQIAKVMAVPFDHLPEATLAASFTEAGFQSVEVETCAMQLVFPDGVEQALAAVFATPIGPRLRELPSDKQEHLRNLLRSELSKLMDGGTMAGKMTSLVLTAERS